MVQAINITDTNQEKEMLHDLRAICKAAPINVTIFNPYFVYFDQFELVRPTALQSMVIGAIIMMLISFIFIPNILCSLWVAFSIVSIELGVAGYMSLWDVNLDSISMINLIMCIGFSVDFTAHICYTYMSSKANTPDERVKEALYSLGLPILQGSISTLLGSIALIIANSYIFLVFFKMIFLVIFFGAMHGLFLLPVLLSLFGPGSCSSRKNKEEKDLSIFEKPAPFYLPQITLAPNYGSKTFLNAPYKTYDVEKDLGLGTSGEDSSESSSNKSQRKLDDEATRRRYEEGWRRSSHNLVGPSQFQSDLNLFGYPCEDSWRGSRGYLYDEMTRRQSYDSTNICDTPPPPPLPRPQFHYDNQKRQFRPHLSCDQGRPLPSISKKHVVDAKMKPRRSHSAHASHSQLRQTANHNMKHMSDIRKFP